MTVLPQLDQSRLLRRLAEIARFGATGAGGLDRQALSADEVAARSYVLEVARERGFGCAIDAIGNLFVRRDGTDVRLPPLAAGSHLDSQPKGGRFDGTLGVMAALEVLEALADGDVDHRHPIEAVVWTNEEGSRFAPGTMGSSVYAGAADLAAMLGATDAAGTTVAAALAEAQAALGPLHHRQLGLPFAAYVELHIEQGPVLESLGYPVGVVDGIQGARWLQVDVAGRAGHAGTTPEALRRDAGDAAIRAAAAARAAVHADGDARVRFTIGRIAFMPGSINTIPAAARFTIDLRHPDAAALDALDARLQAAIQAAAAPCGVTIDRLMDNPPTRFDSRVIAACADAAERYVSPPFQLTSGAFHDAQFAARLGPAGMIFIPCADGISHAEVEDIEPDHAVAGTQVLMDALLALDRAL
ncbi:MAG: M20 family metallo-hydrolase [Alphaproteobacteria bacterium]